MGYGIAVEVKGKYALFGRPEFKVERYSYDVITPSAARGILDAVYFKPQIRWRINRIHVYEEPRFISFRRNEVSEKISSSDAKKLMENSPSAKGYLDAKKYIQQRASTVLRDVRYVIEADFVMTHLNSGETDLPAKHYNMMLRRLKNGQNFHQPYLGCREFPAEVTLVEGEIEKSRLIGEKDLGFMLYDMDFADGNNIQPVFFRAKMIDGVIDVSKAEIVR